MNKAADTPEGKYSYGQHGNINQEQLQEYSNLIKQRAQFYREENMQMEAIFNRLKLLNDELINLASLRGIQNNLENIMVELEVKSLDSGKVELGHAARLKKQNNYLSKLKFCIRHYSNLNENISKQIKFLKSELDQSKQTLDNVHLENLEQLEEKARKYENELVKFEKKYPWLKRLDYDLPNIAKHFNTLKSLKEQKESLLKELNVYQNLKPDIKEAKQQLAELKKEVTSAKFNFKV